VRWAAWLEETVKSGTEINEWDAAEKLTEFRRSGDFFAGVGIFPPISFGSHMEGEKLALILCMTARLREYIGHCRERWSVGTAVPLRVPPPLTSVSLISSSSLRTPRNFLLHH
jgi:hypothetical protein